MIYDVYHDESKEEAFWHAFLFIPKASREEILDYLKKARLINDFKGKRLSFKILKSNSSFNCAKSWLSILVSAFQQGKKDKLEYFCFGKTKYDRTTHTISPLLKQFSKPPKCKIAIFHLKHGHRDMEHHHDDLSKIETTFRMGLQGAAHYLFNKENPLEIENIFLDREKHYRIGYKRDFNKGKVLERLSANFRDYCLLCPNCKVFGEELREGDTLFLDLADIILGTFRFGILNPYCTKYKNEKEQKKSDMCKLFLPLVKRLRKGYSRMQNSRFVNFGTFSSAWIENGEWRFENLSQKYLVCPVIENLKLF